MKSIKQLLLITSALALSLFPGVGMAQSVSNPDFEKGAEGWSTWSQEPKTLAIAADTTEKHGGAQSLKVTSTCPGSWTLRNNSSTPVVEGEKYEWKGWIKISSLPEKSKVTICAAGYDTNKKSVSYSLGQVAATNSTEWQQVTTTITVPANAVTLSPRIVGNGACTFFADDFVWTKK